MPPAAGEVERVPRAEVHVECQEQGALEQRERLQVRGEDVGLAEEGGASASWVEQLGAARVP